jgi:hypothetical protein
MLLLTATSETQGERPGDFCDAIEGELVVTWADCHVRAHEDELGRCCEGCPARFFGLNSGERTTTAMARDVPISRQDYFLAMGAYAQHRGSRAPESLACVLGMRMVDRAVLLLPGTVVGFAGGRLTTRTEPQHGWRDFVTGASCFAGAFAWRRHYGKTIRTIDRTQQS